MKLEEILDWNIDLPSENYYVNVKKNWDNIAKPLDSLGDFEEIICRIGAILEDTKVDINKRALIIMCADNGVVEEGISQSTQEVTSIVACDMGKGKSNVNIFADAAGVDTFTVDIGINNDELIDGVLNKKVAKGTRNFANEPAMTEEELASAIYTGMELVRDLKEKGYRIIATGEMGIGNTTTSSAMAAAYLKGSVSSLVGRGAGLSDDGLEKKKKVIKAAIEKYDLCNADAQFVLRTVGGLDIAGLTGVFLGGAKYHIPIIIDGVISLIAAYTANLMKEGACKYFVASHIGREPAMKPLYEKLDAKPVIDAGMALGEGCGAVMLFPLLDMALKLYSECRSFGDIEMTPYSREF